MLKLAHNLGVGGYIWTDKELHIDLSTDNMLDWNKKNPKSLEKFLKKI